MDIDQSQASTATDLVKADADEETIRSSSEEVVDRPLAYYDNGDPIYPDQSSTDHGNLDSRSSYPDMFSLSSTNVASDGLLIYPRRVVRPFDLTASAAVVK